MNFYQKTISTPLGNMIAIADDRHLLVLDFDDSKHMLKNAEKFPNPKNEENDIIRLLEKELSLYFQGKLHRFSVPILFSGTEFQQKVWNELLKIPFGKTISYQEQAIKMNIPKAIRAVANANSKNKICIIVPCHRVIGKNKKLTGYAAGLDKKEFLLNLEKENLK